MITLLAPFKFLGFVGIIISYGLRALAGKIFIRDYEKRRHFYTNNVSRHTWLGLKILNGKLKVINEPAKNKSYLLVGNHLGFLDILFLASRRDCLFITSVEMKNTPLLGQLCEMAGCVFVERRSRSNIGMEIGEIRKALKENHNVVLYPEGTSTNGEKLLPFKKSLMTAAAGTGVPILPMVLNYTHINGEPMSPKWRDYVCWYGNSTFFGSFLKLLSLKSFAASIEFLEEIHVHSEEQRREVAHTAQLAIEAKFKPIREEVTQ